MGDAVERDNVFLSLFPTLSPSNPLHPCVTTLFMCFQMTGCFVALICTFLLILGSDFILLTQTADSKERRGSGIKYSSARGKARLLNENYCY